MNTTNTDNTNTQNETNTNQTDQTKTHITTVESLVAEARARGFNITGGFMPKDLIPIVEAAIAEHRTRERGFSDASGDFIEWKQHMDRLQQFLALLKTLPAKLPYTSATPGTARLQPRPPIPSPFENPNPSADPNLAAARRQQIEQLQKQIEDHIAKLPPTLQQHLKTVPPPSTQASDPRLNPVYHPSPDASDASTDASAKQTDPSQSREEYFAQILRESTSHSPLDDFPPERQQQLYQLLLEHPYTWVVRMIAKPEPLGWNFQTSDTSLKRFKKRYEKKLEAAELAGAHAEAEQTIKQTGPDEQAYTDATRRLLKIRLFKNAAGQGSDTTIELLIRLLDRQRRTDLAERRVHVLEQRVQQHHALTHDKMLPKQALD